jgi:hypothetical protein
MFPNFDSSQMGPEISRAPGGPLDGLQDSIASVLNANGDRPNVYIPGGPGEPVFQVPNIRYLLTSVFRLFSRR